MRYSSRQLSNKHNAAKVLGLSYGTGLTSWNMQKALGWAKRLSSLCLTYDFVRSGKRSGTQLM